MANTKISALTAATTPVAGTEVLPIVQSSTTKQVSIANLTAGRSVSAADYVMSTGNLVPSTAAKGINFTANTPAAGMTSQLLNWYEEGTWTATDQSGAGLTLTNVDCYYTRVGRMVTAHYYFTYPVTASVAATVIGGLPFTAANTNGARGGGFVGYQETGVYIGIYGPKNNKLFSFITAAGANVTNATCSGKTFMGCQIYFL
jgi:hypothetical protein